MKVIRIELIQLGSGAWQVVVEREDTLHRERTASYGFANLDRWKAMGIAAETLASGKLSAQVSWRRIDVPEEASDGASS